MLKRYCDGCGLELSQEHTSSKTKQRRFDFQDGSGMAIIATVTAPIPQTEAQKACKLEQQFRTLDLCAGCLLGYMAKAVERVKIASGLSFAVGGGA